jgi:hypothetical protein
MSDIVDLGQEGFFFIAKFGYRQVMKIAFKRKKKRKKRNPAIFWLLTSWNLLYYFLKYQHIQFLTFFLFFFSLGSKFREQNMKNLLGIFWIVFFSLPT